MAIEKLPEFSKNGQKNTDKLVLEDGFPVNLKPARQWFNFLFNQLTLSINQIIDENYIQHSEIINNLTSPSADKPLSAKQGKALQEEKLAKTENAVSASKLETARTVQFSGAATGSFGYDGSANSACILTLANSGVIAGTYGSVLKIPAITVNSKGLVTVVAEQEIQVINDLTTGGANKILSAEQGKVLQETKLGKYDPAIGTQLPAYTTNSDNEFIRALSDHSGTWFDNGGGKHFNQYSMGFSAARTDAGFMMFGMDVLQAQLKVMSGVLRPNGSIDYLKRQTLLTTEGNAATATKLQTARTIAISGAVSGNATFDGASDVTINVVSSDIDVIAYTPIPWMKVIPPSGFLVFMGQSISQAVYPILFSLYGPRLPDMRGEFIRGFDNGRGVDVGRTVLSEQQDDIKSHIHPTNINAFYVTTKAGGAGGGFTIADLIEEYSRPTLSAGGTETRPKNIAFNYIVKAG